jgi:hypothetical protein
MSGVIQLLAIVGVVLAVASLLRWLWEIRKSGVLAIINALP